MLFDVDGTIAETEGDGHLAAFNQAFAEAGIAWHWRVEDYARLLEVTGGYERMLHYAQQIGSDIGLTEEGRLKLLQVHRRKNTIYAQRMEGGAIAPRKGFIELVDALTAQRRAWGVVTTTSASNWQALWDQSICRQQQIAEPFVVVCGEDVSRKKPDPEAYQLALKRLAIGPQEALAIEDSRNGLMAAQAAGIGCIVVRSQFFGHQCFDEALTVVNELTDLLRSDIVFSEAPEKQSEPPQSPAQK